MPITGAIFEPRDGCSHAFQIVVPLQEPCTTEDQILIVDGEALGNPQHVGVVFLVVVEWPQRDWPDTLHIVEMKELMGDVAEPSCVTCGRLETRSLKHDHGGVGVFDASIAGSHP